MKFTDKTEYLIVLYALFFIVANFTGVSILSDTGWAPYIQSTANSNPAAGAAWVEGNSLHWADGSREYYTENDVGTVGYWNLNSGSGTTAVDNSGSSNDGSLVNSPTWTSGRFGQGLDFDGTDDYVDVADSASLDITEQITIAAWVNPDNCGERGTILTKNTAYYLQVHSDCTVAVYTYYENGGSRASSSYTYSNTALSTNTWSHIAFVEEPDGTRKIYINGNLDKTASMEANIWDSNNPVRIGAQTGSNRRFDGTIDEVRLYNSDLSGRQIKELASGHGGLSSGPTGSFWLEDSTLNFIDQNSYQRGLGGVDTGSNPSGAAAGNTWIEDSVIHYIDSGGNERKVLREYYIEDWESYATGTEPATYTWTPTGTECWEVNTKYSQSGSKSLGNDYNCDEVIPGDDEGSAGYTDYYKRFNVPSGADTITLDYYFLGITFDGSGCSDPTQAGGEDDSRPHLEFYDSSNNLLGSWTGPSFSGLGKVGSITAGDWMNYGDRSVDIPTNTAEVRVEFQGGDNNNNCGGFTGGGNAGGYLDNINIKFH